MADITIHNLLPLEAGVLQQMANDPRFVTAFPFIRSMQKTKQRKRYGCGGCNGTNVEAATTFNAIKSTIAHMGQDSKRRLKQMLNARQVRIVYLQPGGGSVTHTF